MSWSIFTEGTPAEIREKLAQYAETLTGPSLAEFEAAETAITVLLRENWTRTPGSAQPILHLEAYGSGSVLDGVETSRSCSVSITRPGAVERR